MTDKNRSFRRSSEVDVPTTHPRCSPVTALQAATLVSSLFGDKRRGLRGRVGLALLGRDVPPRPGPVGHDDPVIGQQRALGLLQGNDRYVISRPVLGLGPDGRRILTDCVQEAVDCDPALRVICPLGIEPGGGGSSESFRRLELLIVGVDLRKNRASE